MSKYAWVTLTTNDTYSLGALVLAHSLKRVSTAHQLAVLVTPGVSEAMRNRLKDVYNVVQEVNILDSQDTANLALLARPELGITFTKLHCWKLVQFEKCVFLDADILVIKNCDELFDREELAAAPDISWPDCFNSGVFVYRPNLETFSKLIKFALENGSFDGGDQGLLNQYFSDWAQKDISKHLPFIYNTHAFASYSYLPAFKQFRDSIKILHFAGRFKPWLANFNSETKTAYPPQEFQHAYDLIQLWWDIYCNQVHHSLSDQMVGLAGALSKLRLGEARTPEQEAYEQHIRRQCWEAGNIDYTGKDSFDNIWKKITQTLESGKKETQPPAQSDQDKSERVLTSADIEDGKTEYDPETQATITYKKVPKGYQQIITTPQPNGTTKTQTKTFYDPVPMTAEEIEEENRLNKKSNNKNKGTSTVEIKKIPGGHEEITTTVYPDGTTSIKTKTVYDAQEVVESNQQVVQDNQKNKRTQQQQVVSDQQQTSTQKKTTQKITQQQQQQLNQQQITQQQQQQLNQQQITQQQLNQQQITQQQLHQQQVHQQQLQQQQLNQQQQLTQQQLTQQQVTSQQVTKVSNQEQRTQKIQMQHQSTFEEVSHFSQTTEVSGKSITTHKGTIEEQNIQSITEKKDKKKKTTTKNTNAPPAPPKIVDKPGEKTSVVTKKITGGTEYHYTTVKEDGTVVTSIKTVYEEEEVEMTEREIKEYKKQLKEAEKHKNVTKTTALPSKVGTKKVIPSENPGEVTTVEEVKIQGGTEYHYTTVTAEGIVKKSSKTIYDPVPVAGESDEEEIIEEYEEEIIEPGEPIVTTTRSTKPLNDDDKKKLAQDAPASKKKEKKSGRK